MRRARPLALAGVIAVALVALIACPPQNLPKPMPPSTPPGPGYIPPGDQAGSGSSAGSGSGTAIAGPGVGAAGSACSAAADCESGICEGEGCGAGQGVCAARQRSCTYDLRTYCGCDGTTFDASGSCPERRFSHRGACTIDGGSGAGSGTSAGGGATGAACQVGADCASGICEGKGCGADAPGTCAAAKRGCTRDRRTYCGCDGVTFYASGSCPGKRYRDAGACPGS
jgi:hypothetical protein